VAELQYFTGTMDSGKSTLALQTNHNHAARGRVGRIFTSHDRAGESKVSSRLGVVQDAGEVGLQVDVRRPREVPRLVLGSPVVAAQLPADVEDREPVELVDELLGRDQRAHGSSIS
jgi:hypothetical protein